MNLGGALSGRTNTRFILIDKEQRDHDKEYVGAAMKRLALTCVSLVLDAIVLVMQIHVVLLVHDMHTMQMIRSSATRNLGVRIFRCRVT